jgi:hypothetical protein
MSRRIENLFSFMKLRHFIGGLRLVLIAGSLLLSIPEARCQDSTKTTTKDSLTLASKKDANKAALMSAVIPGLGQIHNKKYWKVPIIYGGGLTLAYFIHQNNYYYQLYKDAYANRLNGSNAEDPYPALSNEDLSVHKDYYRRNRDLCYIFVGLLYVMNIVDAYVDAQLKDFDVSDNLSIRTSPDLQFIPGQTPKPGLKVSFCFK